jgi:hypothetical protein
MSLAGAVAVYYHPAKKAAFVNAAASTSGSSLCAQVAGANKCSSSPSPQSSAQTSTPSTKSPTPSSNSSGSSQPTTTPNTSVSGNPSECGGVNNQQDEQYNSFVTTLQSEMNAYQVQHNSSNDSNYQSDDTSYAQQLDASSQNYLDGADKVIKSYGCSTPYPTLTLINVSDTPY